MAPARGTAASAVAGLRLASGLLLVAFATSHLLNHALGLHSLELLEAGRRRFLAVWRASPGSCRSRSASTRRSDWLASGSGGPCAWRRSSASSSPSAWRSRRFSPSTSWAPAAHRRLGIEDSCAWLPDLIWPDGMLRRGLLLLLVRVQGCIGPLQWLRV